ncbi:MAG: orotate phosphoribosyltransferase [Cytophagales bacterium]|nr:orotate phosphoribosyltransferase [Bernardetiaceae bacterium]MDW8210051.1 orotate phosphoribosyltransferase [Cytophagales bacterium]
MDLQRARTIAAMLLQSGAVKLSPEKPFTWSSGWKAPIYCDNRVTLSFPEIRTYIKNALASAVKQYFPQGQVIAGVATAGIPQGTLVADLLELPFIYVRTKPKEHGLENLIEGKVTAGANVVVIEDLISTGKSSLQVVQAIRQVGMCVSGLLAVFSYDFDIARQHFQQEGVRFEALCTYPILIEQAIEQNYISQEHMATLQQWRQSPQTWKALE